MTRRGVAGFILTGLVCVAGCQSAFVEADIRNGTNQPVSLIEVDYPSAGFGVDALAAGGTFHYRFKVQGDGATKIQWTDRNGRQHSDGGPVLHEGQQGQLTVTITGDSATWVSHVTP